MPSEDLLVVARSLKNMLVARATGDKSDRDAEYQDLRQKLMENALIGARLPECVLTCWTLSEFWGFIQPKFSKYQERREYLRTEFAPLLQALESMAPPTNERAATSIHQRLDLEPQLKNKEIHPDPKHVFIIHGRNSKARMEMGIFLRACGLTPINFSDLRAEMGGTPTVDRIVDEGMQRAQGVIALFTPDEFACLRPEFKRKEDRIEDVARWQARPNVIFEAGMAFGRDRNRVVFVLLGEPTLFTDVAGVHVLRPTNERRAIGAF
jgi:hypothetical protein